MITLTVRAAKEGEPSLEYCKVLNRLLPKDIRVVAWKVVPENFSARFDCKKRTYRYFFPRGDLDLKVSTYHHHHRFNDWLLCGPTSSFHLAFLYNLFFTFISWIFFILVNIKSSWNWSFFIFWSMNSLFMSTNLNLLNINIV